MHPEIPNPMPKDTETNPEPKKDETKAAEQDAPVKVKFKENTKIGRAIHAANSEFSLPLSTAKTLRDSDKLTILGV